MIIFFCFNSLNVCLKQGFVVEVRRGEVWEDRAAYPSFSLKDHMTNKWGTTFTFAWACWLFNIDNMTNIWTRIWLLSLIVDEVLCIDILRFVISVKNSLQRTLTVIISSLHYLEEKQTLAKKVWKNHNFLKARFSLTRREVYSTQASCFCLSSWVRVGKKLRNATNTEVFARRQTVQWQSQMLYVCFVLIDMYSYLRT